VFGAKVATLPDQLVANHLTWRAYVAGQGAPGDTQASCRHPAADAADATAGTEMPADAYVTRRNPFVYFGSLTKQPACSQDDVGITQLGPDLAGPAVPNFSWIAPDLCTAGADGGCPAGATATGAAAADAFLSTWIPQIEATSAYKQDGMIVIVSDQAPAWGPNADSSACCGKLNYANTSNPGGSAQAGAGGGRTGALVLSPFAAKGKSTATPADHFTLLRTLEDIFNLPYLGYAAERHPFGQRVFPSEAHH
jgi:phosphatidylinositol-3-phosphatase